MKPMTKLLLTGILAVTTLTESSWACGQRCQPVRSFIQTTPSPNVRSPQPQPTQPFQPPTNFQTNPNGLKDNNTVINDLPIEAKLAIRAAAAKVRAGSAVRQPVRTLQ